MGCKLGFFIVLIGLWEIAGRRGWVDPQFLPTPSTIFVHMKTLLGSSTVWRNAADTFSRVAAAFVIGAPCGVGGGVCVGG